MGEKPKIANRLLTTFLVLLPLLQTTTVRADLITEHLNGRVIREIVYDSDRKLIWVATANDGVFCFGGARFTQYDSRNSPLPENRIEALALDLSGKVWVGTRNHGALRFDVENNTWEPFDANTGLVDNSVNSILADYRGIWFGTEGGLGLFDGMNFYRHTTNSYDRWDEAAADWQLIKEYNQPANRLSHNKIHAVAIDSNGAVWCGTEADISVLRGECDWDTISVDTARVNAVFVDQSNAKWFGTTRGVYVVEADSTFALTPADLPACFSTTVFDIAADTYGGLWFATNDGAPRYDPFSQNLRCTTGIPRFDRRQFRSIASDEDANLWFGATGTGGIIKYTANWISYSTTTDDSLRKLNGNRILSLAVDQTGQTWIGTERGFARYDQNGWRPITLVPQDSARTFNQITAIEIAEDTTIWLGTNGLGVLLYTPQAEVLDYFSRGNTDGGLVSNAVLSMALDGDSVWVGTRSGVSLGVSLYDDSTANWDTTFTVENTNGGLVSDQVQALAVDLSGRLWCGTPLGLSRYDGNWTTFTPENTSGQLGDVEIGAIEVDPENGTVWVATLGGGVSSYLDDQWENFTINDGLADNIVQDVLIVNELREVWFASAGGVSRMNHAGEWTAYRTEDGLADNNILTLATSSASQEIWFGTRNLGVTRYQRPATRPQTFIESPNELTVRKHLDLRVTTSREIIFRFVGADLNTPNSELRYSFRLDDEPWSPLTFDTFARLVVQENGPHAFQVKAIDQDNNEDQSPAVVSFHKIDPDTGITTTFIDSSQTFLSGNIVIELYWPPYQLPDAAQVSIVPVRVDTLSRLGVLAYDILPADLNIERKGAILSFAVPDSLLDSESGYSIHRDEPNPAELGGTLILENGMRRFSLSIDQLGRYVLRRQDGRVAATARKDGVNAQPRIFSPHGGGHARETNVSFVLSEPTHVKVSVYNLAGRLVETICNQHLPAGSNVITWDGKDRDGGICPTGLYILIVQSPVLNATKKVMVLNESKPRN